MVGSVKKRTFCFSTFSKVFVCGLICILGVAPSVNAQEQSTLRVLVKSQEDGTPIAGANVMVLNADTGDRIFGGITDRDGLLDFSNIAPRSYRLQISFVGFKTHSELITLEPGETRVVRVALEVEVGQLDELVVEDEREVTTGEVGLRRISREDIGRVPSPVAGGDLASYLQSVPSVISTGDRGGELHIRGGTPSQNKVLVDNLPIIKPFHISNLFSAFPEYTVQNVDLFAGGFGAEYMGATSAIIDVSLRPGNYKQFNGGGSISPYMASLNLEGPLKRGSHSILLMGRKSLYNQSSAYLLGEEEPPMDFYDLTARYSYQGQNYTCNATGITTHDEGQINPSRSIKLSWRNIVVGGRCVGFAESLNHPIEITAGYSYYTNSETSPDRTERSSTVNQLFFAFDHQESLFGVPIDYGFKLNFRTYKATLAEQFTSFESFDYRRPVVSVFASTVWEPNKYLTVEPSLGSMATIVTAPTFEPRLRMMYQPDGTNQQEISVALGRYHQVASGINDERDAGTVFTVWRPDGEDIPLPEALHAIAGYQQRIGNHFKTNIEGYYKRHYNISVSKWTPIAKLETETALANGTTYGFDIAAEYRNRPFYLSAGYGYASVAYEAASGNLGAWIEEPIFRYSPAHDQRHKFNVTGSYEIGKFTASVRWEYGSGKPYTRVYGFDLRVVVPSEYPIHDAGTARTLYSRPYGQRLPVYHRLDVSVGRTFHLGKHTDLKMEAGAINIYDRDNIFYFDANTLERINQTPMLPYLSLQAQFN